MVTRPRLFGQKFGIHQPTPQRFHGSQESARRSLLRVAAAEGALARPHRSSQRATYPLMRLRLTREFEGCGAAAATPRNTHRASGVPTVKSGRWLEPLEMN